MIDCPSISTLLWASTLGMLCCILETALVAISVFTILVGSVVVSWVRVGVPGAAADTRLGENGICQNWNLSESIFCHFLKKLEFVIIGICQNWNLSELEFVRIGICQNWNWSESEFVRIGICQNRNLSESEFVRIGICQNWNLSELEFVRIGICPDWNLSELAIVSFGAKNAM